jgi:nucleoside-diphosphate-sugar epimerase
VRQQILITGATGFIGRALVAEMVAQGSAFVDADVHLLVRDRARAVSLGLPPEALCVGELRDAASWVRRDFTQVVHLAGAVRAVHDRDFFVANAAATAALAAALPAACRLIHVSSLAAAGPSGDGAGTDALPADCRPVSRYGASKLAGERAVLAEAERSGRPWLVLRPCLVYGPEDAATALLFRQACARVAPVPFHPRPIATLHVRDAVAAIGLALCRREVGGACLPLAGEITDTHALLREIAAAAGQRARLLRTPTPLATLAGHAADLWSILTRRASFFSADKMREVASVGWVGDPLPAQRSLGFVARVGLREGLAEVARARR